MIPVDAHVRLAHPDSNDGAHLLRRGYNFTDGSDGFRPPRRRPVLHRVRPRPPANSSCRCSYKLMLKDALTEYLIPNGQTVFACPPAFPRASGGGADAVRGLTRCGLLVGGEDDPAGTAHHPRRRRLV